MFRRFSLPVAVVLIASVTSGVCADFVRHSQPMALSTLQAHTVEKLDAGEKAYKAEYAQLLATNTMARRGTVKWHIDHIPKVRRSWARLDMDRRVYWDDDPVAQVVVNFMGRPWRDASAQLAVYAGNNETPVRRTALKAMTQPRVALLLTVGDLPPGDYRLVATLPDDPDAPVEVAFAREAKRVTPVPIPAGGIAIDVQPQNHLPDAVHPIVTGIPFPQGAVRDVNKLTLYENNKPIPSQITAISMWHPHAGASVRWAHLRFIAQYRDGKPATYTLRPSGQSPDGPKLTVTESDAQYVIDTGAIRFAINRKAFNGIAAAWLGDTQLIATDDKTPAGPYIVDQRGIRYDAQLDDQVEVSLEESGPLRAVIAAKGWMVNPKQKDPMPQRKCQFVTRFIAWAGSSQIDVQHHTILTFDTDSERLLDVGFDVPTTAAQTWSLGLDGKTQSGALTAKASPVFLHQYRWDRARIANLPGKKTPSTQGAKSDGWFRVHTGDAAVTAFVPDIWRKFPKEVELSGRGMTFHAWPAHGMATFADDEMYPQDQIYKLRWHHHGRLLDLRFPSKAYTALKEIKWYDPEHMAEAALNGNGQGIAIAGHFALRFGSASEDASARAKLHEQNPHARASGKWFAGSLVEGRIAPRDAQRFPAFERDMDTFFPSYLKAVVDRADEYGMFTYAGTHNNWYAHENRPQLHRVWQASHYRHVSEPWLHYLRGGPFDILCWARANTDRYMELGIVNYAGGKVAQETPWHVAGAMYHAKGFTPWGSIRRGQPASVGYKRIWGHHINPDALLMRWFVEADRRALDLHRIWVEQIANGKIPTGAGREAGNTANEVLGYYAASRDARMVPLLNDFADDMLSVPFNKWAHPHFPTFNPFWFMRLHALSRDARIAERLVAHHAAGNRGSHTLHAMIYWLTGRTDVLDELMGGVYARNRAVYFNNDDPLTGYRRGYVTDPRQFHQQSPYWLAALIDAGKTAIEPATDQRVWYPTWTKAYAINDDGRAFTVRIESPRQEHPFGRIAVVSPNGKTLVNQKLLTNKQGRKMRFLGDDALVYPIAAGGETGLYEIEANAYISRAYAPYTDLPHEAAVIAERAAIYGVTHFYVRTVSNTAPVDMTIRAVIYRGAANPVYIRLTDADGAMVYETTLLFGSKRSEITLKLGDEPYRLYANGAARINVTGDEPRVVLGLTREATDGIAAQLRK